MLKKIFCFHCKEPSASTGHLRQGQMYPDADEESVGELYETLSQVCRTYRRGFSSRNHSYTTYK